MNEVHDADSLDMTVFSEGSLGRDFLCGFLRWGGGPLAVLFGVNFSSKLNRPGLELWSLFPSVSLEGELFFLPSLGDLALVGGICTKVP